MSINMEKSYFREVERAKAERWPVLIPIGTMEYHSTICPYGTDTLVSLGIAEKLAERIDCMVMPPIYYGVASYAVGGPETNTLQVDCDTFELYIYQILKSLFRSGFNRNIYMIISHQTEDYNPMTLACMKAARKLIFEYLDQTKGYGWWGKNENKEFYKNMTEADNPWNWIRVIYGLSPIAQENTGADHAGKYECSYLEYLFPDSVKIERLSDADDWFAEDASEMSVELGKKMAEYTIREYIKVMGKE